MLMEVQINYNDKVGEIDLILSQKRYFWRLESIVHVNYDDICQIIRLHIFKKWEKWDQTREFKPWVTTLINNQLINLWKQYFGRFAPPCKMCEHDLGGTGCAFSASGEKDSSCLEYQEWERKKESAYRIVLAESLDKAYDEDPEGEGRITVEAPEDHDYESATHRLHRLVLPTLNDKHAELYRWLFIEHRSDVFVAEKMGFKSTETDKIPGYKQIRNIKKLLIKKVKKVLAGVDIFETE